LRRLDPHPTAIWNAFLIATHGCMGFPELKKLPTTIVDNSPDKSTNTPQTRM
jgi:hypothetical protein